MNKTHQKTDILIPLGNKREFPVTKGIITINENEEVKKLQKQRPNWYVVTQKEVRNIYLHQQNLRTAIFQKDMTALVKSINKKRVKFLDIGCGDGVNLKEVKDLNLNVDIYGCDYNALRLSRAKALVPEATIFLADANKEVIKENSVDILLLNHVLEHVPDDVGLLKKMYSYLAPGGYALIGIPQEGTAICKLRNYVFEPYILYITDHVHFYKDVEIKKKIKQTKFNIKKFQYLNYHFPHSIIDRHLRKSKKMHDFMERNGAKLWKRGGAGALWIILQKPKK